MNVYRQKRKRPTGGFYLLIAAVAVGVFLIVFFLNYNPYVAAENGKMTFETERTAVVARDEDVITKENYGKVTYIAAEGEYVTEDAEIAQIYKIGYNDKVLSDLLDVQTKIGQYQENVILGDVQDQSLIALNTSIEAKASEISDVVSGKAEGDLIELEKELKHLLEDKMAYLKEAVKADAQLEQYYAQEEELEDRVNSWRETVCAESPGVVSFYFDGCEPLLNASNVENITYQDINEILNGTSLSVIAANGAETPLYRLVNSYKWYLLIPSSERVDQFEMGEEFYITFDEYLDKQYTGRLTGIREEEVGYVYVMEINDDIGPLISTRRTNAHIYTVFTGVQVPVSCVKTVDGVTGVYVKKASGDEFVPVTVLMEEDGKCIIRPVDETRTLTAGMEIHT